MTYSGLGAYDRREAHPERYPACATADEKAAAHGQCTETTLRGLGGKIAGLGALSGRFSGANPCWVETLPTCPTCLTLQQAFVYAGQIAQGKLLKDPIAALSYCSGVPVPPVPKCLPPGSGIGNPPGYDLIQYCRKAGGTDPQKNAACYLIMRSPAYWSKVTSVAKCRPPPKLITVRPAAPAPAPAPRPPPRLLAPTAPPRQPVVLNRTPPVVPAPTAPPPTRSELMAQPGISTGSLLLVGAAAGGVIWLWRRSRKPH